MLKKGGLEMLKSTFGSRLRNLREDSNLTQTELANIFKVTPPSISQYEKDVRSPDYSLLIKIADFFNVSVDYLLGRTNVREINKGKEDEFITMAAHRADDSNSSPVKDIEGLKDLVRSVILEHEKEKNK